MRRKHDAHMDEMEGVAKRLRDERPEASPLELDQIKTTAMSRAKSGTRGRVGTRRLAVAGLTAGLLIATTGGVLAASEGGGGQSGNAAIAQYGKNCIIVGNTGNGGNENGNGSNGNGAGNGNGNGTGNGNGGSFNGNGSGDFNCNENSFNTEITNITTINNTTGGNITNNYYTVNAAPAPTPATGVQGSKTTKPATSSRHIKIHVHVPHGLKLRKVSVSVDGKPVKTLKGKKASNIELVNLPCSTGATTVKITVTLSNGKTATSTHQYHLCVA